MAAEPEFDLSYITERIIAVSFHSTCPEQTYLRNLQNITQMLQSKHADNYLVVNISEPREELRRMSTRVLDVGWPELRAPSLHLLCSLCKSMENWLDTCSEHVLLLHCRGNKDRIGVVISSYIQLPSVSTSEEQALDRYTMKRFYSDKMASLMTPSQKRYVQMFGRLLAHQLKINSSPLLFHCVCLHHVPNLHPTVCRLFIRVYQGMQPVCTTGVHQVSVGKTHKVYFALEPPQLLKGDVMIVCYYKNAAEGSREPVFRLQFHTGTLHGHPSLFYKKDLDHANKDPRFPENGMVEVVFSETMTNIPVFPKGGTGWKNNSAVVIDYDTLDPLVYWDSYENLTTGDQPSAVSVSSDSDLSSNLQWTRGLDASHSLKELPHTQRPVAGHNMEDEQPPLGLVRAESLVAGDGDTRCSEATFHFNGKTASPERETDILDDEDGHVPRDTAAPGPGSKETDQEVLALSSLACKESCPCSVIQAERIGERESAVFGRGNHGMNSTRFLMHSSVVSGIQTDMWVKQQQLVSASSHRCTPSDGLDQRVEAELESGRSNSTLPASCSPDAKLEAEKDDEFASLALDIDQSIEQLNQLILDLDPEFEPVPTRARNHMTRSASLHTNGIGHSAGQAKFMHSGWRQRQISDVTNQSALRRPAADLLQPLPKCTVCTAPKCGSLYRSDSIDYGEFASETVRPLCVDLQPPPTPTFPVSPPTPYVKSVYDFSLVNHSPASCVLPAHSRPEHDSRGYVDSMTHAPVSSDGDLFHSEVTSSPASCQTSFGSMRSMHTPSPLPASDGTTAAHRWLESGSNAPLSHYTPQPSPPLSLSAPNAHSSPRGLPRGLSSSVGVGSLERSLLEAMEGLESLGLDGTQPPLLPQKRRELDGEEHFPNSPLRVSGAGRNSGSPRGSTPSPDQPLSNKPDNAKFVQDTSKFWYKPDISREQAIAVLKDKEPGSFIVRDSHSFRGAYGLAMKVATPPPSIIQQSKKGDLTSELVRHFLIECTQKGVRLKGCPNEPYFGSLTALVCQHSITSLALPCRLNIPSRDPLEELNESQGQTSTNSAAELLKQGAACNVWFLGSVELESLTGVQAVQKATTVLLGQDPPVTSTIVHFKVSAQGITLTDNQRKLFFRRHYAVNTVIFCALDPQARKWTRDGCLAAKIFGFVARKSGSGTENMCHLFAEHDPEQPASAIVNFVSKVMIGSQKAK
ncbi:tensin-3 isoform X2 [Electrophorus electricus]|uniref:tensin-3 isoform X2 n=1 Tax=Electrophorus electricus TaxID=8005 RepID=UPI0015D04B0C|nr:tensin-3 isoform X2 [Electrophorus electricus]